LTILGSIASLISTIIPLILVRVLSESEVGIFKAFFLFISLAPNLSLAGGLVSGLSYFAARPNYKANVSVSGTLLLAIGISWSLIAFLLVTSTPFDTTWSFTTQLIFAGTLFGSIAAPFFEDAAIARGHLAKGAIFNLVCELSRGALLLLSLLISPSVETLCGVQLVFITTKAVVGYFLASYFHLWHPILKKESITEVVKYALPVSFAAVFSVILRVVDQVVLALLLTPAVFAIFSIGSLTVAPLYILEQSVTRVLIPNLTRSLKVKLWQDAVSALAYGIIPAVFGLHFFAEELIVFLFTKTYVGGAPILKLFSLSYLLLIIPPDSLARARGDSIWILSRFATFAILTTLLSLSFCYFFGPLGAIAGTILGGAFFRVEALWYCKKYLHCKISETLPWRNIFRFTFSSALTTIIFFGYKIPVFLIFILAMPTYIIIEWVLRQISIKRNPTQVLHILQSLQLGGLERMVCNLACASKTSGKISPSVFAYAHDENSGSQSLVQSILACQVPVEVFNKKEGFSFLVVWRLLKIIDSLNIGILHTHDLGGLIYGSLTKLATLNRIRLVHTQHSFIHLEKGHSKIRYRQYERFFTWFVDSLTAVSDECGAFYSEEGISKKEVTVIENGINFPTVNRVSDKSSIRRELGLEHLTDKVWLLYLGRVYPGKGQDRAIKAWSLLSESTVEKGVLIIVGPDQQHGLPEGKLPFIDLSALPKGAYYSGATDSPFLWLQGADIFVSLSEYEGQPLAPAEALGSGLITILSNIPGHMQYQEYAIKSGGKFVDGNDLIEVAETFTKLIEGTQFKRDDVSATVQDRFSCQRMVDTYCNIYLSL
jgi:O-antigen/teichoic acid export membrane protein